MVKHNTGSADPLPLYPSPDELKGPSVPSWALWLCHGGLFVLLGWYSMGFVYLLCSGSITKPNLAVGTQSLSSQHPLICALVWPSQSTSAGLHLYGVKTHPDDAMSHAHGISIQCLHFPPASPSAAHQEPFPQPSSYHNDHDQPQQSCICKPIMFKCRIFDTILKYAAISSAAPIPPSSPDADASIRTDGTLWDGWRLCYHNDPHHPVTKRDVGHKGTWSC